MRTSGFPVTGGVAWFLQQTGSAAILPAGNSGCSASSTCASAHPRKAQAPSETLTLVGDTRDEFGGSRVGAGDTGHHLGGLPPVVDLAQEKRWPRGAGLRRCGDRLVSTAHVCYPKVEAGPSHRGIGVSG